MNNFSNNFLKNFSDSLSTLDLKKIEKSIELLNKTKKKNGRLFILGIGGSAGNASHAVNDFRKLCNIETYAPTDNPSEITARTNDEGFETIFEEYLKISKLNKIDLILIFSVVCGNIKKNVSTNLIKAIKYGKKIGCKILSIVGKNDGFAFKNSDCSIFIKSSDAKFVTPISESMQVVIWHLFVSHPKLKSNPTKW